MFGGAEWFVSLRISRLAAPGGRAHSTLLHEALFLEPEYEVFGPRMDVGEGRLVGQADAVSAFLVNVKVERDVVLLQGGGEVEAVLHFHGFVFDGVPDEAGRGVFGNLLFVGEEFDEFCGGFLAEKIVLRALMGVRPHADDGVAEDAQIGPAALAVDRIRGVGLTGIEVGDGGGGEVSAGGRADDADAFWVELPFASTGANQSDGTLGVLKHTWVAVAV